MNINIILVVALGVLDIQCASMISAIDCSQPENIILDEETGKVKVVDFGAVQDVASSTLIGSTVVGTVRFSCSE